MGGDSHACGHEPCLVGHDAFFVPGFSFLSRALSVPTMMMRMMVVALPGQKIDFDTGLWTKVALLFGDVVFILLPMISAN
jgi:hypothetical protein